MPDIPLDLPTFEFFARYVLAGFIIFLIRQAYVAAERPKVADIALDIALLGLLNQLVFQFSAWVCVAIGNVAVRVSTAPEALPSLIPGPMASFFIETIAVPILIGIASGRALAKGWTHGVLRVLSIPIVDPLPRAYDHVFSTRGVGFVIVTYKDGTQVFGYYGEKSRAGRDPNRSELYLERLYLPQDVGPWEEMKPPRSVLLNLAEVRSIEFIE